MEQDAGSRVKTEETEETLTFTGELVKRDAYVRWGTGLEEGCDRTHGMGATVV